MGDGGGGTSEILKIKLTTASPGFGVGARSELGNLSLITLHLPIHSKKNQKSENIFIGGQSL